MGQLFNHSDNFKISQHFQLIGEPNHAFQRFRDASRFSLMIKHFSENSSSKFLAINQITINLSSCYLLIMIFFSNL